MTERTRERGTFCWTCGEKPINCKCGLEKIVVTVRSPKEILPSCSGPRSIWRPDGRPEDHTCLTKTGVRSLKFIEEEKIKIAIAPYH